VNRDAIFSALDLNDLNAGAYAGGWLETGGTLLEVENPSTGEVIGSVKRADANDYEKVVATARGTFGEWRMLPEVPKTMFSVEKESSEAFGLPALSLHQRYICHVTHQSQD